MLPENKTLDEWLESLPEIANHDERGQWLVGQLRDLIEIKERSLLSSKGKRLPASLTFGHSAVRSFEVQYWKDIATLSAGKYVNKANSDCILDPVTQRRLKHHHRDLEALGDYLKQVDIPAAVAGIRDEYRKPYVLTESGEKYYFDEYHTVFSSIEIDRLWGEDTLPYTGRMMIPLLIPGLARAFPDGAESLHYSSCEFQTRVTEMKVITRHESPDTLILIEVPVLPGAADCFPANTIAYATEHNLFAEKAYPQQSEQAFATYHAYVDRGRKIPNLRYVGRHAEFKYWGMAETVNSAYQKSLEFAAV